MKSHLIGTITAKPHGLVWLLSVLSVDFLPLLGHGDLGLPYSVC